MPRPDEVVNAVRDWVQKAEDDFKVAADLLSGGRKYATTAICFHAQQSIEKYAKAYLVYEGIHFARTHNIEDLIALIPTRTRPDITTDLQALLTDYAVTIRYPGESEEPSMEEARIALQAARRIRSDVRRNLPRNSRP